jgi:hypothetical protein
MELWRKVWRDGLSPLLSLESLEALRLALIADVPSLKQGQTTDPPALSCMKDFPVDAACLIGYCGWVGDGLRTVGEVDDYFGRMCFAIDQAMNEQAGCRWLLEWFDSTPRSEMRAELLPEVERSLARRRADADETNTAVAR